MNLILLCSSRVQRTDSSRREIASVSCRGEGAPEAPPMAIPAGRAAPQANQRPRIQRAARTKAWTDSVLPTSGVNTASFHDYFLKFPTFKCDILRQCYFILLFLKRLTSFEKLNG